jgi:hypothetical protein
LVGPRMAVEARHTPPHPRRVLRVAEVIPTAAAAAGPRDTANS